VRSIGDYIIALEKCGIIAVWCEIGHEFGFILGTRKCFRLAIDQVSAMLYSRK
jgi:hypothetical protein